MFKIKQISNEEIKVGRKTYHRHHDASRRGYCHVADVGTFETYSGRFGNGYIRINGGYRSNQYTSITYYTDKVL